MLELVGVSVPRTGSSAWQSLALPGGCLSLSSDIPDLAFRLGDTLSRDIWILSAVISDLSALPPSLQLYTWSSYKLSTGRHEPLWLAHTSVGHSPLVPASSEG